MRRIWPLSLFPQTMCACRRRDFIPKRARLLDVLAAKSGADFLVIAVFHGESFFGAWNVVCQYVHVVFHACGIWFEEYGVNVFGVKQGFVFW